MLLWLELARPEAGLPSEVVRPAGDALDRTLHTAISLLTEKQKPAARRPFADDAHVEVEAMELLPAIDPRLP